MAPELLRASQPAVPQKTDFAHTDDTALRVLPGGAGSVAPASSVMGEASYSDPLLAADVWSFGVLLYEVLTGALPPQCVSSHGATAASGTAICQFDWIRAEFPQVADLIAACLALDPARRPAASTVAAHPWFETDGHMITRDSQTTEPAPAIGAAPVSQFDGESTARPPAFGDETYLVVPLALRADGVRTTRLNVAGYTAGDAGESHLLLPEVTDAAIPLQTLDEFCPPLAGS